MLVFYKNVFSSKDISNINSPDADVIILNYHSKLYFNISVGIPVALTEARRKSKSYDCAVLLHSQMNIEGEEYLSTIFIDRGEIAGVADCISKKGVHNGRALRSYNVRSGQIGIVVDDDVRYSGVDNLFAVGAETIFHNTLSGFDKDYYKAYKCHSYLHCGRYFGLFSDCAICMDGGLKILPSEGYIEFDKVKFYDSVARRTHNVTSD